MSVKGNLGLFKWFQASLFWSVFFISCPVEYSLHILHTHALHSEHRCSLPTSVIFLYVWWTGESSVLLPPCGLTCPLNFLNSAYFFPSLDLVHNFQFLHIYPMIQIYYYYMIYTCLLHANFVFLFGDILYVKLFPVLFLVYFQLKVSSYLS